MHKRRYRRKSGKLPLAVALVAGIFAVTGFLGGFRPAEASGITAGNVTEFAFFKEELSADYEAYMKNNPDMTAEQAVVYCNIGLNHPFYTNVVKVSEPERFDVLCNKYNQLDSGYIPEPLVAADGIWLRAEAAAALSEMRAEMDTLGMNLTLRSGYRSYNTQRTLYNNYAAQDGVTAADTYSARAGHSEHQTGLAVDLIQLGGRSGVLSNARFQDTAHYAWMLENAHRFGYILRYPKGYEKITGYMYEPWHWRYVGVDIATEMKEQDISTYDEYCAMRTENPNTGDGELAAENN